MLITIDVPYHVRVVFLGSISPAGVRGAVRDVAAFEESRVAVHKDQISARIVMALREPAAAFTRKYAVAARVKNIKLRGWAECHFGQEHSRRGLGYISDLWHGW